jgi:HD superfamily phosphohydrolase
MKTITSYTINNPVYGSIIIDEPVIVELIKSLEFERLKGIDMAGYSDVYFPGSKHTRYDHAVGVYYLLRSYGAPLEEQIYGLLHDISHSAFSHVIDYALKTGSEEKQTYQDNVFKSFVSATSIPAILRRAGHDPEYIFNEANFPLQERALPDLCADRIDYTFRGAYHYGYCSIDDICGYMRHLRCTRENWYFDSYEIALRFAGLFAKLDDEIWDHMTSAVMFRTVGDCLMEAIDKGYLSYEDLFETDCYVLEILRKNSIHDKELGKYWRRMNKFVKVINNPEDYDAIVPCKSRIIDPLFLSKNAALKKISEQNRGWASIVENGMRAKVYYLKFIE